MAERAELNRVYEAQRSERLAEEGRAIVNRARVQLQQRLRARRLEQAGVTQGGRCRQRRQYERACREIGAEPVATGDHPGLGMAYLAACEREAAGKAYRPEPATTRTHTGEVAVAHQSSTVDNTPASGEGHGVWPRRPI